MLQLGASSPCLLVWGACNRNGGRSQLRFNGGKKESARSSLVETLCLDPVQQRQRTIGFPRAHANIEEVDLL